jgi:excisionase family DNA binding protein
MTTPIDRPDQDWVAPTFTDLDEERKRLRSTGFADNNARTAAYDRLHSKHFLTKSEFLTKQQAGEYLSLSTKTIERLILRGEIPAYKVGRRIRIRRDELEDWIKAQQVQPYPVPDLEP